MSLLLLLFREAKVIKKTIAFPYLLIKQRKGNSGSVFLQKLTNLTVFFLQFQFHWTMVATHDFRMDFRVGYLVVYAG